MKDANHDELYIRLVRQAKAHYLVSFSANLLNSAILAYILRDVVSHPKLIIWLLALLSVTGYRAIHAHYARPRDYLHARKTARVFILGLALSGVMWGMLSLFLYRGDSLPHLTFIVFSTGGMVAGASVTTAALNNAFFAFTIPALLPLIARCFAIGTEISDAMGLMLLVFFGCLVAVTKKIQAAITQAIRFSMEIEKEITIRKSVEHELRTNKENLENAVRDRTRELHEANTDLARQIQERKQTERKYQEIFNSTSEAMLIHEASTGEILEVNQAMLDMYGYSPGETATLTIEDISEGSSPYSQMDAAGKIQAAVAHGPQLFEWRARRKNQKLFWVEVAMKYTEFGTGQYIISVIRDIDARKKDEEVLLKAKKLESVGILAGGIAHDFNNILTAILGNISVALFDQSLTAETRKVLTEAGKASVRARDLTQQLLTFSKGGEPVRKASSLRDVIQDSAMFVLHGRKSICSFHIPEGLFLVDIDQGQISQVIQNIVLNADQAMPAGGVIKIVCGNVVNAGSREDSSVLDGRQVRVEISDSGMGISPEYMDNIFDPYFSTKSAGSGLGLAICQSIISKHHGSISVSSMPGKGSTFTILLPASSRQESQKTDNMELEAGKLGKHRVLVMEDEEQVRNVTKTMLSRMGLDVVLVKDGAEAIELYAGSSHSQTPIELIIMDLTIPGGMGGKEAAAGILKINPDAKIIVASGYSNDPIMARPEEYGFCAAIEKPFQVQDIKKIITPILNDLAKSRHCRAGGN